jgi:hypothetical protein
MNITQITPFSAVYDSFFSRITDDMYMELTEHDTYEILQSLLMNAIPRFEFPRVNLFDFELGYITEETYQGVESNGILVPAVIWRSGYFNHLLSLEEINILSLCMVIEWLGQQLETVENTRMKYCGSDYKFTSQANHMAKLKVLIDAQKSDCFHLQRFYKRRIAGGSGIQSTMGQTVSKPSYGVTQETLHGAASFWSQNDFKI